MSKKTKMVVSRALLIRAFTSPERTRQETMDIVARYMGSSPVPPSWGLEGVRGTFGKRVARAWARKVRHLTSAHYRDPGSGRVQFWVTQTAFDLGLTPQQSDESLCRTPEHGFDEIRRLPSVAMDEFHLLFGRTA